MSDEPANELAQLLLRSARLDVPRAATRARVLERALAEVESKPRRGWAFGGLAAALVALALGALWLRAAARGPASAVLRAEPPRAAASASAQPSAVLPPCPKLTVAQGGAPLIDDLEDRNARLSIADGRSGSWMVYNDGSGKQTPPGLSPLHPERIPKGRADSRFALHTFGEKFSVWGAMFVGTFTDGGCYDVSAYSGVEFFAKGNTRMHLAVSVIDEISVADGGLCASGNCYSAPYRAFDLGPTWKKYSLGWEELERLNQPKKVRFDPKRVVSLNFSIHREDTPFDVWVDDVRFSERH